MDDHTVVGRVMAIIDATLAANDPVSLADLSRLTEIPKPTARRLAMNLTSRGLLHKSDAGYSPGPRLADLGARAAERNGFRTLSEPYLQEMFERTRGVIWLVELRPAEHLTTLVTAVFDRTSLPYSNEWPRKLDNPSILATALGLVALTDDPRTVETHLRRGIPKLTRHTPDQPRQVLAALARAAGDVLAVEHEQVHLGWSCLAIPITGPGSANAVLGVVDRTARFNLGRLRHTALTAAAGIGKEWRERDARAPST